MVYLGGTSRKHYYGGEVGSKACKPVYTVHYLVSFHCGHLGFRQFSRRGDHGSCAEHASELKKLEMFSSTRVR